MPARTAPGHSTPFPYKADVKSLVWYVPENFEDAGYEVPGTMEELKALTEQIVADGETPWCIGLGSGGATGWPATDWVEDMMLRTQPPSSLRPVGHQRDSVR
jgi:alpha-glucoside transport system substrate-binding protein